MKILLITDNYSLTGGAERYFFALRKHLQTQKNIDVFTIGFGETAETGNDFIIFKKLSSNISKLVWQLLPHPLMYFKLKKTIDDIKPDIIHIHNIKQYSATLLTAIKAYPIIQTVHDYGMVCPVGYNIHRNQQPCPTGFRWSCFWQHQVKYNILGYCAMAFAFSKNVKRVKKHVSQFFAPSPLLVTYLKQNGFNNTVYIPPFKADKAQYSFDKMQPNHFVFAGNLGKHKGVDHLINEFALAYQKNKRLKLTLLGTGKDEVQLRQRVKSLHLQDCIIFEGWQDDMDAYYEKCSVVIFPSLWVEAFGLVITEAMSFARPVIGSNRGSPPWLVEDQKTGLIFDPCKAGDLAQKILQFADNTELVKEYGVNGFNRLCELINNETILTNILNAYQDAAHKKGC